VHPSKVSDKVLREPPTIKSGSLSIEKLVNFKIVELFEINTEAAAQTLLAVFM
jgi:hypothetical protein